MIVSFTIGMVVVLMPFVVVRLGRTFFYAKFDGSN